MNSNICVYGQAGTGGNKSGVYMSHALKLLNSCNNVLEAITVMKYTGGLHIGQKITKGQYDLIMDEVGRKFNGLATGDV